MSAETHTAHAQSSALLLAVCAAPDDIPGELLCNLDDTAWSALVDLAIQTRTAGLLHYVLDRSDRSPDVISNRLQEWARKQAQFSLLQTRSLARSSTLLAQHGIEHVVLKGFALDQLVYPRKGMRPLRDLDLLCHKADAERAQGVLLDNGFQPLPGSGQYGVEHGHQLPEIFDPAHQTIYEIHHRLNARHWAGDPRLVERTFAEAKSLPVLGADVKVPSDHALFLHMVEHASIHHLMANGPLTLGDLHFMAKNCQLDWDAIEHEAEEMEMANALLLVMAVAQRLGARWIPPQFTHRLSELEAFAEEACEAMLVSREDFREREMLRRMALESGGRQGLWEACKRALSPAPSELAKLGNAAPGSVWRWAAYPRWLIDRGRRYWRSRKRQSQLHIGLQKWLRQR